MKRLDSNSPIPLYAQLAEAIRYQIASGALEAGEMLPALRSAAREWGVNLHTVRRAYSLLAEKGVVRTDAQVGTVVLGRPAEEGRVDPVDWFISRTITEAYERHGLSVEELKLRLERWGRGNGSSAEPRVFVVEGDESEASALATQLGARWAVSAEGWSMQRPGGLPDGLLIASLQQYNEIRVRWPDRVGDVRFVRIQPDGTLASRVVSTAPIVRAVLCEKDLGSAKVVAADLRRILPSGRVEVVPHVVSRPGELLSFVPDSVDAVLFPPRMWNALDATERANPKAYQVRYIFDPKEIERIAEEQGWLTRGD